MRRSKAKTRLAAVGGAFYPDEPSTLRDTVSRHIDAGRTATASLSGVTRAIIAPHAGYIYSGPTAGVAFASLEVRPARVVLIGPAHRVAVEGISVGDYESYQTPLGAVPVDREAVAMLLKMRLASASVEAHRREHCLEVMLPFVVELFGATTPVPIVPLLVGQARPEQVDKLLERLLRPDDLLIVSSDLSHFLRYGEAQNRDRATLAAILRGDWRSLGPYDACGHSGVAALIRLAQSRGWRPTLLDYRNSGDTAGDHERVVGYGAIAYTEEDGPPMIAD